MRNLDDKYPTQPGFEPSPPEFWVTTGSNEPSGRPSGRQTLVGVVFAGSPCLFFWLSNIGPALVKRVVFVGKVRG